MEEARKRRNYPEYGVMEISELRRRPAIRDAALYAYIGENQNFKIPRIFGLEFTNATCADIKIPEILIGDHLNIEKGLVLHHFGIATP